jgi:hypothetical protein
MIQIDKLYSAIKKTFYYDVIISKQNKYNNLHLRQSNLLFDFEIKEKYMILRTPYLSPCMYIRNVIDPYKKDENGNYVVIEQGNYINKTNTQISFNGNNSKIPVDYIIISRLFSYVYNTESNKNNIEKFEIRAKDADKIDFLFYEQHRDKLCKIDYQKCWTDFNSSNTYLDIHHKDWITSDLGVGRYHKNKSLSDFTQCIFKKINNDIENNELLPINKNCNDISTLSYRPKLSGVAKFQGGINTEALVYQFGYSNLLSQSSSFKKLIRCNNNRWNTYYCSESDIQSVVILNNFLRVNGLKTTLKINSKIDSNNKTLINKFNEYINKFNECKNCI